VTGTARIRASVVVEIERNSEPRLHVGVIIDDLDVVRYLTWRTVQVSRMNTIYLLVAGLCLCCLAIRTGYELLKKAGRVDARNRAIFIVVFVAMCVMLMSWPAMCPRDPWRIAVPGIVRWLGLGMATTALVLALGGLVQLRGVENIDHLVTTALFSRIRHPMYAGFILWIVGWVVRDGAVVSLAVGLVCIGNILYWRRLEESALETRYGEDYRTYRQRTWF
jgi:protein-S-isoprenylcysteine O-methyltransferase Ste14